MNGLSMPYAPALKNGESVTYSSGRVCQSMVASTSPYMEFSLGYCVGPTRTAFAWNMRRMPRSPKKP